MKNLIRYILISLIVIALTSCGGSNYNQTQTDESITTNENTVKKEYLMGTLEQGLTKVTLDDSTIILIYREIQACTMIQLK